MASDRAIDKLKKAFSIGKRSSYPIYKDGELILQVYWTPLTIADRDAINDTLIASNKVQTENSLDFALQVIIACQDVLETNKACVTQDLDLGIPQNP